MKAGYWNVGATGLTVVVPIDQADNSLVGGSIQIQASKDNFVTPLSLGAAHPIVLGDLSSPTYTFATFDKATFEALAGFAAGDVWKFRSFITDVAGNTDDGTVAANALTVDIIAPAAATLASRTSVTAPVVANYFNKSNTQVTAVINIPDDASLVGGNVKLQARVGANNFVDIGNPTNAIPAKNTTQNITIDKTTTGNTDLDELTGWADGVNVDFRAVLTDIAGNSTDGTTFGTPMAVDMTQPITPTVVINGGNVINTSNQTNVFFGNFRRNRYNIQPIHLQLLAVQGTQTNSGTLDVSPKTLTGLNLTSPLVQDGTVNCFSNID